MTLKKILVATDFSEQAEHAVGHAMAIARHTGAELSMMHALGLSILDEDDSTTIEISPAYHTRAKEIETHARERLETIRERHLGQGVELSHVFVDKMPEHGILMVADETGTDLIVVGSHGRNRMSAFFLGSVSRRIVKKASCDVMVARNNPPTGGYKRVLVPTDFSAHSDRALERAGQLVEKGGVVEVLHCWQLPNGPVSYWGDVGPSLHTSMRETALERGKAYIEKFATDDVKYVFVEQEGPPRHLIEQRVEDGDFDLVVVGSHGRRGLDRWLLGSVAESTVTHLGVSVYLAR